MTAVPRTSRVSFSFNTVLSPGLRTLTAAIVLDDTHHWITDPSTSLVPCRRLSAFGTGKQCAQFASTLQAILLWNDTMHPTAMAHIKRTAEHSHMKKIVYFSLPKRFLQASSLYGRDANHFNRLRVYLLYAFLMGSTCTSIVFNCWSLVYTLRPH